MAEKPDPFSELERIFEDFVMPRPLVAREPAVDVVETDDEVQVMVDLPGRDTDAIDVTLEQSRRLTVSAPAQDTDVEGRYAIRERSTDEVSRSIALPREVDEDGTEANYTDGVLTVTLPFRRDDEGGTEIRVT